jgi:hypothetical protein
MNFYHNYIYFIIFIKFIFVVMTIFHLYLKTKGKYKYDSDLDKKLVYWKEKIEFLFGILMSILLIYLFNPSHNRSIMIDHHTKVLLYIFGFILLITAKWNTLFVENYLFKNIQKIIGEQ